MNAVEWLKAVPAGVKPDAEVTIQLSVKMNFGDWLFVAKAASMKRMNLDEFASFFLENEVLEFMERDCRTLREMPPEPVEV